MTKKPADLYLWATTQCAARECCPSDIAAKLQRKGATPDEAEALVARLTDENYLNEERYARAFASDKFRFDHWGRIKIRYALRMQRISDSCIDEALADIPEADYRAVLADFLTAKERTTSVTKNWCALRLTADSNLTVCVTNCNVGLTRGKWMKWTTWIVWMSKTSGNLHSGKLTV